MKNFQDDCSTIEYMKKMANFVGLSATDNIEVRSSTNYLIQFQFYDVAGHDQELVDQNLSQDIIIAHLDLFYAECRAYGRIVDEKRNSKIFVRCHGFTFISALQKALFSQKFNVSKRKTLLEEYDRPAFKRRNH